MNDCVIDQIPPLAEFEQWLVQLSVVGAHQVWRHSGSNQKPFILELVAEMRQLLLKQLAVKWTAILDGQRHSLSDESPETVQRFIYLYIFVVDCSLMMYRLHIFTAKGWRLFMIPNTWRQYSTIALLILQQQLEPLVRHLLELRYALCVPNRPYTVVHVAVVSIIAASKGSVKRK